MSGTKLIIERAPNKQQLLELLAEINTEVLPRTEGRTNEQTEMRSICYLLATLSSTGLLSYHLSLEKSESPDFILTLNQDKIGIEITESIPPAYAECLTIRDKEKPDALIDISLFKSDSPHRSKQELREIVNSLAMTGSGWEGDSAEIEWAKWIFDTITRKLEKLEGYEKLPDYWLLIYDNLPLPHLCDRKAIEYLIKLLYGCRDASKFSRVYVERNSSIIIEIETRIIYFRQRKIVDLWQ